MLEVSFNKYKKSRLEQKQRGMQRVLKVGGGLVGMGVLAFIGAWNFNFHETNLFAYQWGGPILVTLLGFGVATIAAGLILMTTCPPNMLDLDRLLKENWKLRTCLGLILTLFSIMQGLRPPYLTPIAIVPVLPLLGGCVHTNQEPRPTTMLLTFQAFMAIGNAAVTANLFISAAARHTYDRRAMIYSCWNPLASLLVFSWCWWRRQRYWKTGGQAGSGPTLLVYQALYLLISVTGVGILLGGSLRIVQAYYALLGTMMLLPLSILAIGRDKVYRYVERKLMRIQALHDGAFLAELAISKVEVGQVLWHPRGDGAQDPGPFKHNRQLSWKKGFIVKVLNPEGSGLTRLIVWREEGASSSKDDLMLESSHEQLGPTSSSKFSAENLLEMALATLYCTDYAGIANATRRQRTHRTLVKANQQIDYFVCYSWDDFDRDPERPLQLLKQLVERFKKSHGREPTFWFDKVTAVKIVNLITCHSRQLIT